MKFIRFITLWMSQLHGMNLLKSLKLRENWFKHMEVPGPDGRFGFGGACFPKDLSALINFANDQGENLELLKSVKTINNKIRSNYEDLDKREKEQNVSFDI